MRIQNSVLLILLAILIAISAYTFINNSKTSLPPSPIPTKNIVDTKDWNKFESQKYNYSFMYPKNWEFNPFDEMKAIAGTHSLSSYDTTGITKYMDHGIINLEKYGKSIAKVEISPSNFTFPGYFENGPSKKYVTSIKEYIDAVIYTEVNESGYEIESPTVNYKTSFTIDNIEVSEIDFKSLGPTIFDTVKAYYIFPERRVIRIGVYFKGVNEEKFDNSPLKQEVDSILQTFKFINISSEQKACTLEAKLCPDGSSVGRVGPNCEFSPCP